jgi:hypothetical protein
MNTTTSSATGKIGLALCTSLLGTLTGCVGHNGGPPHGNAYVEPRGNVYVEAPSTFTYVENGVVVPPGYVYYPEYQVYYSGNTRQYVYLEGRSWVSRTAPPHVSASVLFRSPSIRLDFHDSPALHHAAVVRQYPKHWAPPGPTHGDNEGRDQRQDEGKKKEHS